MTSPQTADRRVPVAVLAVVALVAALAATMATGDTSAHAGDRVHAATSTDHLATVELHSGTHHALSARESRFHDRMRKLWEDHITWTRLAIVAFADGSPGFDATAARLLRNQTNLGNSIKRFYGDAAGDQLTALLHDHITIAVELLQAAKAGDSAAVQDAAGRWYANANDIADFLAAANPRYWPRDTMRAAMKEHLDQTLAEAQHELSGDYAAGVVDYDAIHHHILVMADLLSDGIIRTFPGRFR
jgi:hypothetical protein